jgi:putative membrane protein (TIGR04086 family)
MNWKRALLGGFLAEVLVLLLIAPVALATGFDKLADPASLPQAMYLAIIIASFLAPLLLTQWVARRVKSQFVLHGFLVGFTAFVVYMIPLALSGESQPLPYWIAHAMKILGGITGGLVAARRRVARGTPAHA